MKRTVIVSCCYSAVSVLAVEMTSTATEDVKPVAWTKTRRRKQKYRSPIQYDDSSDTPEQEDIAVPAPTATGRSLRSHDSSASGRVKKRSFVSLEVDDENNNDAYEPETVNRTKKRKSRRH